MTGDSKLQMLKIFHVLSIFIPHVTGLFKRSHVLNMTSFECYKDEKLFLIAILIKWLHLAGLS